jgi:DNA gyrase/topoisomerase IV subunit A
MTDEDRDRIVERLQIVEATIAASEDWANISGLIAASPDTAHARAVLTSAPFSFSEIQVESVLDLGLRRLTAASQASLIEERTQLRALLAVG